MGVRISTYEFGKTQTFQSIARREREKARSIVICDARLMLIEEQRGEKEDWTYSKGPTKVQLGQWAVLELTSPASAVPQLRRMGLPYYHSVPSHWPPEAHRKYDLIMKVEAQGQQLGYQSGTLHSGRLVGCIFLVISACKPNS